jgi:hypothetical protein
MDIAMCDTSGQQRLQVLPTLRQMDALAAWLLLGWLGQRLGWSFASGLLPVVFWWAVRCVGTPSRNRVATKVVALWVGLLAAVLLLAVLVLPLRGHVALATLLLASVMWGAWSASLDAAWGEARPTLAGQAMGLMMGSLWLSSHWCLGPSWTYEQTILLHLGLMAGLPWPLALLRRQYPNAVRALARQCALLLAIGALIMAWPSSPTWRVLGMSLLVLAWSLPLPRRCTEKGLPGLVVPYAAMGLGPALLLAIGLLAPTHGPAAMQAAWWLMAALALVALALSALMPGRPAIGFRSLKT